MPHILVQAGMLIAAATTRGRAQTNQKEKQKETASLSNVACVGINVLLSLVSTNI